MRSRCWLTLVGILVASFAGCGEAPKRPAQTGAPNATATVTEPSQASEAPRSVAGESEKRPAASDVAVEIKDFDGIQSLIASKRGKVVVMDCWSTWCDPCVKEFPGLVALHKKYGPD